MIWWGVQLICYGYTVLYCGARRAGGCFMGRQFPVGLNILAIPLRTLPARRTFTCLRSLNMRAIRLNANNCAGRGRYGPSVLLTSRDGVSRLGTLLTGCRLRVDILSYRNGPIRPSGTVTTSFRGIFIRAYRLTRGLNISAIIAFSNYPNSSASDRCPG